jgi:protein-tyrosine phosphatase
VAEGSNRVRVLGLDPAVRHYVTVAAPDGEVVMAAERLVPLTGTMNFRDLGGYRGEGGRTVRWGRVFRSDGLDLLTDDDVAYLGHLGIVTVCDFRNDREVGEAPSRLPGTVDLRRLPIGSDSGDTRSMVELMVAGELTQGGVDFMADLYVQMLDAGAEAFATAVALAADPANLPLLVHCTAGKDRTGIISALILSLLGVREDDIVDDYELTTKYRSGKRIEALRPQLEAAGVDVDAVRPIFTAERAVLVATLEDLRARWGGIEDYLTTAGKLAPAVPARLRQVLLA